MENCDIKLGGYVLYVNAHDCQIYLCTRNCGIAFMAIKKRIVSFFEQGKK